MTSAYSGIRWGTGLAMRRLEKEYLDHYLKGEPAADWIKTGVPYKGK